MLMLTTAGVICLRSGASEAAPLVRSRMGRYTPALALISPTATARPSATMQSSLMIATNAVAFSHPGCQVQAGPKASLHILGTSTESAPPVPVPVQFKANVEIGVGADISAGRVVYVLRLDDALRLRSRQCTRGGDEDDGESKCGFGEHDIVSLLFARPVDRTAVKLIFTPLAQRDKFVKAG